MEQNMTASPMKSELAFALAKVQGAIVPPKKDTANPFFKSKYADLAGVWESVRGLLSSNGLAFLQLPTADGQRVSVTGKLMHVSGESIESTITGNAADTKPQSIGSCITYLRRYQMSAMLGIAAEDDDGNAASGNDAPVLKQKTPAQERPGFDKSVPFEQHRAELEAKEKAKAAPAGQIDHGQFVDYIKNAREVGRGKKGNVPWVLHSIETEGHGSFSTFDTKVYEAAQDAIKIGAKVLVDTEPTAKGPKINGIDFISGEAVNGSHPVYEGIAP